MNTVATIINTNNGITHSFFLTFVTLLVVVIFFVLALFDLNGSRLLILFAGFELLELELVKLLNPLFILLVTLFRPLFILLVTVLNPLLTLFNPLFMVFPRFV